ncbi:MAG: hypothetical protein ACOYOV_00055 [Bacteroidales bacterium]
MDQKLNKIDDKLDRIVEKLHEIEIQLTRNTDSLEIHEKRSDINEQEIELVQKEVSTLVCTFQESLHPITEHIAHVKFVLFKIVPAVSGTILFVLAVAKFFSAK